MHFHTIAPASLVMLLFSGVSIGADRPPVPGSYRPTTGEQVQASPQNRQFVPTMENHAPPAVIPPPQPTYGSQPYWNNGSTPGFSISPGRMMNDMFPGGSTSLPYGYPNMAAPAQVAPVYDPPIPATPPGWSYGSQSPVTGYASPTQPTMPNHGMQATLPAAPNPVPSPGSIPDTSQIPQTAITPPPLEPTPSGQGRGVATLKPAPRPLSNPQETGNAFVQRSTTLNRTTYGGNDSRFRPPELKGTP